MKAVEIQAAFLSTGWWIPSSPWAQLKITDEKHHSTYIQYNLFTNAKDLRVDIVLLYIYLNSMKMCLIQMIRQ